MQLILCPKTFKGGGGHFFRKRVQSRIVLKLNPFLKGIKKSEYILIYLSKWVKNSLRVISKGSTLMGFIMFFWLCVFDSQNRHIIIILNTLGNKYFLFFMCRRLPPTTADNTI